MHDSDEQIIAVYQATGRAADLSALVCRHIGNVRSLAFQVTLDDAAADDITQEVFLNVMRGLKTFRGEAKLSTWLYRVTINTAQAHHRRQRPTFNTDERVLAELPDDAVDPEQLAMNREMVDGLERALQELPPKLRAAIALTSIQRLSPREAAQIEQCSTATMYWRIHQARKLLKQKIERHLER